MSDVELHSSEYIASEQTYLVDFLADDLVRVASVIGILKSIDEGYEELIPLLKTLTSELVMELHTTSYVEGIVDELCGVISKRLWEIDDEFKLSILINDVVFLGKMIKEGVKDSEYASEVLNEFIETFSIDLTKCKTLQSVLSGGDPPLILQTVLIGLVLSVGGLSYDGG